MHNKKLHHDYVCFPLRVDDKLSLSLPSILCTSFECTLRKKSQSLIESANPSGKQTMDKKVYLTFLLYMMIYRNNYKVPQRGWLTLGVYNSKIRYFYAMSKCKKRKYNIKIVCLIPFEYDYGMLLEAEMYPPGTVENQDTNLNIKPYMSYWCMQLYCKCSSQFTSKRFLQYALDKLILFLSFHRKCEDKNNISLKADHATLYSLCFEIESWNRTFFWSCKKK